MVQVLHGHITLSTVQKVLEAAEGCGLESLQVSQEQHLNPTAPREADPQAASATWHQHSPRLLFPLHPLTSLLLLLLVGDQASCKAFLQMSSHLQSRQGGVSTTTTTNASSACSSPQRPPAAVALSSEGATASASPAR